MPLNNVGKSVLRRLCEHCRVPFDEHMYADWQSLRVFRVNEIKQAIEFAMQEMRGTHISKVGNKDPLCQRLAGFLFEPGTAGLPPEGQSSSHLPAYRPSYHPVPGHWPPHNAGLSNVHSATAALNNLSGTLNGLNSQLHGLNSPGGNDSSARLHMFPNHMALLDGEARRWYSPFLEPVGTTKFAASVIGSSGPGQFELNIPARDAEGHVIAVQFYRFVSGGQGRLKATQEVPIGGLHLTISNTTTHSVSVIVPKKLPTPTGRTKKATVECRPVDLGEFPAHLPGKFRVQVRSMSQKWGVLAMKCKRLSSTELVEKIRTKTMKIPTLASGENTSSNKNDDDDDLEVVTAELSLQCPLMGDRICVPAKGLKCTHSQCFDLESWLSMCERSQMWYCPCCPDRRGMLPNEVVIDIWFENILKDTRSENFEKVPLSGNGEVDWAAMASSSAGAKRPREESDTEESTAVKVATPVQSASGTNEVNVIDLDSSDGDEHSSVLPSGQGPNSPTTVPRNSQPVMSDFGTCLLPSLEKLIMGQGSQAEPSEILIGCPGRGGSGSLSTPGGNNSSGHSLAGRPELARRQVEVQKEWTMDADGVICID